MSSRCVSLLSRRGTPRCGGLRGGVNDRTGVGIKAQLGNREREEEVSRAMLGRDRDTVGIWRAVAGGLPVGRPILRSSAFERQALADTVPGTVIGSLHREAREPQRYAPVQDASTRPTRA